MTTLSGGYGVILVTASSQAEGQQIATVLVESKLAACVTLMPIQSIYTWENQLQSEQEWQLMIKTDLTHFTAIATKIQELHSYVVPEIIALPIVAGSQSYLEWIGLVVNSK